MPADALPPRTLGTERAGRGVAIRDDGLILTIGYLITEADQIWIHLRPMAAPCRAMRWPMIVATGFGLVQPLAWLDMPALPLGSSGLLKLDDRVVIGGAGGRKRSVAAKVVGKQEFAG